MMEQMEIEAEELKLTSQQQKALELLSTGKTITEVASSLDLNRTTIWRWTKNPEFQASLNTLIAEARVEVQQSLIALQEKAIETLKDCLSSSNDMVRLKTALSVLDKASAIKKGPTSAQSIRLMEVSFDPKDIYKKISI